MVGQRKSKGCLGNLKYEFEQNLVGQKIEEEWTNSEGRAKKNQTKPEGKLKEGEAWRETWVEAKWAEQVGTKQREEILAQGEAGLEQRRGGQLDQETLGLLQRKGTQAERKKTQKRWVLRLLVG